jgi:hypothetical protein
MSENKQTRRFDDTVWGHIFRFWPLILLIFGGFSFLYSKITAHDVQLAVLDTRTRDITVQLAVIEGDVKTLLGRKDGVLDRR